MAPPTISAVGVVHLIDSLAMGGAERVAVNLANLLPQERYTAYLCTTRQEGALEKLVQPHVMRVRLYRKGRIGFAALRRFRAFIRDRRIALLHAHGSSLFFARLAGWLSGVPVIWHDHYGRCDLNDRPVWLYRFAARGLGGVLAVNQPLAEWSHRNLRVAGERVRYVPNLIEKQEPTAAPASLPGSPGGRIVCVANFRPQKDHLTLLRAMALVKRRCSAAHLLLIGDSPDASYREMIRESISALGLLDTVSWMGLREDVPGILRSCDIGVLSSASEGLPLALLEYGRAGLAAVVTNVGQCREVIADGHAGICVPPSQPEPLADALLQLLREPQRRRSLGRTFQQHVLATYSPDHIIAEICKFYDQILNRRELQ